MPDPEVLFLLTAQGVKSQTLFTSPNFPNWALPVFVPQWDNGTQSVLALRSRAQVTFYYLSMCTEGKISSKKPTLLKARGRRCISLCTKSITGATPRESQFLNQNRIWRRHKHVVTSVNTDTGPSSKSPNGTITKPAKKFSRGVINPLGSGRVGYDLSRPLLACCHEKGL